MSEDFLINGTEIPRDIITKFSNSYGLRTWTSGCYYYNEVTKAWVADGMEIRQTQYGATYCRANHLTSFGTGFFVVPNEINFDYIFANASFQDNLTIYIVVIISMIFYLLLTLWAR
jgi:polycystin 1L2